MKLYFSPLASSMATRIALDDANCSADYIEVCPLTKRTLPDDADFSAINPLGLTPTLITDDGDAITENVAILMYVSDSTSRTPSSPHERRQLLEWLGFVATEIHKGVFNPLFDPTANDAVRQYAATKSRSRLEYLDAKLDGRTYLIGDDFSVADAYLVTLLHTAQATPVDLTQYPNVNGYLERHLARPSVASAVALEMPLFLAEKKRERALQQA